MSRAKSKPRVWELHHATDGTAIVSERYRVHGSDVDGLYGPETRWVPMATSGYALVAAVPNEYVPPLQWASRETVLRVRREIGEDWVARQAEAHDGRHARINPHRPKRSPMPWDGE